jgi:hypothetical protein
MPRGLVASRRRTTMSAPISAPSVPTACGKWSRPRSVMGKAPREIASETRFLVRLPPLRGLIPMKAALGQLHPARRGRKSKRKRVARHDSSAPCLTSKSLIPSRRRRPVGGRGRFAYPPQTRRRCTAMPSWFSGALAVAFRGHRDPLFDKGGSVLSPMSDLGPNSRSVSPDARVGSIEGSHVGLPVRRQGGAT